MSLPDPQPPGPRPPDEATQLREDEFAAQVRRHLKRNYAVHLAHGLLGQTGFRLIQAPTFLPAYVLSLSPGAAWLVGVARACQAAGMLLTPILGATVIEKRRRVLPLTFVTGSLMRLQVLALALSGFFLSARANMVAVCVFLGLFGFFTGMQSVCFGFLTSKIIPLELRGRLMGLRNFVAGATAALVGYAGGLLIDLDALGNGYASLFLVSFALTASGLAILGFVREPPSPGVHAPIPLSERLRQLPALLREDRSYRMYLVARALGVVGLGTSPFYYPFAAAKMQVEGQLGVLTVAFIAAQTGGNLLWGVIADRSGFRAVLMASLGVWVVSTLLLLGSNELTGLLLAFFLLGAGLGGFQLSTTSLVLEFGRREDLPMRIAVAQTAEQTMSVCAPLLAALVQQAYGFVPVFWGTVLVQGAALAITTLRMDEPRHRR